jgi:hypothetical protein
MPRSNRGFVLAIGFGLVAFLSLFLGAYCYAILIDGREQQASEQTQHDSRADPRDSSTATTFSAYPDLKKGACYEANNHDTADLCAQWRAAFAAEESARAAQQSLWLNVVGMGLSAFGLGALLITIGQGRTALRRARKANRISEVTARRDLRAYVDFIGVRLARETNHPCEDGYEWVGVKVTLRNFGKSPAENVSILGSYSIGKSESTMVCLGDIIKEGLGGITPTDFLRWKDFHPLPVGTYDKIQVKELELHVTICVNYDDVFGKRHILKALYKCEAGRRELTFAPGTRVND